jgi:hypothetical protein
MALFRCIHPWVTHSLPPIHLHYCTNPLRLKSVIQFLYLTPTYSSDSKMLKHSDIYMLGVITVTRRQARRWLKESLKTHHCSELQLIQGLCENYHHPTHGFQTLNSCIILWFHGSKIDHQKFNLTGSKLVGNESTWRWWSNPWVSHIAHPEA